MSKFLLTKKFRLEMAHALVGYEGKCRRLHGHSYRLEVTVECEASALQNAGSEEGMGIDFGVIKEIVERTIVEPYDHSLLLRRTAEAQEVVEVLSRHFEGVYAFDWQPTSENILTHFASLIAPHIPQGIRLHSLRLHETAHNCAELVL